jgi:hypothetical protein
MDNEAVFRLSIVLDLVVQVVFILLVLLLYQLFKVVDRNIAGGMAVLFLVSVPIAMYNSIHLLDVLELLSGADYLNAFTEDQLNSMVLHNIVMYDQGQYIAYIFWGLWLFPLGYLSYVSGFIPKWIGVYVMISCFGYLIDFATFMFAPDIGFQVNLITGWAELVMCIWLLVKGVDTEVWLKLAGRTS